jgi:hypothetical protein
MKKIISLLKIFIFHLIQIYEGGVSKGTVLKFFGMAGFEIEYCNLKYSTIVIL